MRVVMNKVAIQWQDGSRMLPMNIFIGIGDLTFKQLSNLRHRGAFSTVSLTFARCCHLSQIQLNNKSLNINPVERWYKVCLFWILNDGQLAKFKRERLHVYQSKLRRRDDQLVFRPWWQAYSPPVGRNQRLTMRWLRWWPLLDSQYHWKRRMKQIYHRSMQWIVSKKYSKALPWAKDQRVIFQVVYN